MTRPGKIMNLAAVLLLVIVTGWGIAVYPGLPDSIPVHWNAAGEADGFSEKSIWTAFGPLLLAAAMIAAMLGLFRPLILNHDLVASERQAYSLMIGYLNLSLALIFGWVAVMGWYQLSLGPWFMALMLLVGVPFILIVALYLPRIKRERQAAGAAGEPSMNPEHWRMGGFFYSNPADERMFVPKPPHTGLGLTVNLASPRGRLVLIGILALGLVTVVLAFTLD